MFYSIPLGPSLLYCYVYTQIVPKNVHKCEHSLVVYLRVTYPMVPVFLLIS